MSYNKNTVSLSNVDSVISLLEKDGRDFKVSVLGKVKGRGVNDSYDNIDTYDIRKLEYKTLSGQHFVILEKMVRHPDCDADDCIISEEFLSGDVPAKWDLEETQQDDSRYVDV